MGSIMALHQTVNLKDTGSNPVPSANTKTKGDIGELEAALWFIRNGFNVSKPIGDNCNYDMIVDKDNCLSRVQVKSRSSSNNRIRVELRSTMRNYNKTYTDVDVDLFFIYDIVTGRMAILDWNDVGDRKELWLTMDNTFAKYEVNRE